ncbi:MAG: hypothetical protein IRY85_22775 [Micromonosporaceae bacterium]|nr:hypothetical protein [Micromonosporaceae bacterium]
MRASWGTVVGAAASVVGSVVWAVSLAVYQQIMEPSGFYDGTVSPKLAENNTYWPREMRQLGILLALAGLVLIGQAAKRALGGAGVLGAVWLAADLGLDRIDIDGRPAVVGLAAAGCAGVALAAVISRGGAPSRSGRHLAAGTAAVLAVAPMTITTPWEKPTTGAFEVPIDNALTTMKVATAVAFMAVTVAMLAPALNTVRSRWLVPVGAAVTLVAAMPTIMDETLINLAAWAVVFLAATIAPVAADVSVARLLAIGGINIVLPVLAIEPLFLVALNLGSAMTGLAGNPPVHAADSDTAYTLAMALLGLALAATSLAVVRGPNRRPAPVPLTS